MDFSQQDSPSHSRESDLLSQSRASRVPAGVDRMLDRISQVEMETREVKDKRDSARGQTREKAAEITKEIEQLKGKLSTLNEHYAALKEEAMELSKPQSSKQLNTLSSTLEEKLEYKKELAQQKLFALKDSQKIVQSIQQLTVEKNKLEKELNNQTSLKTLQEKLEKLRANGIKSTQQIESANTQGHLKRLEELKDEEPGLKQQLDDDNKAIQASALQIEELEDILRGNSKQLSKFHSQIQQQRSKNEQRLKRIEIVDTEVNEVQGILEGLTEEMRQDDSVTKQLTQGIEHLNNLISSTKQNNQKLRLTNSKLLVSLKSSLQQLQSLQEIFHKNYSEVESLHESYNSKMIISSHL